jgi:hypothetical protein
MFLRNFSYHLQTVPDWFQHGSLSDFQSKTRHEFCTDVTQLTFLVNIWWQDSMLTPTSSVTSRTDKRRFPRITARTISIRLLFVDAEVRPGLRFSTTEIPPTLKRLNHPYHCVRLIQSSPYAWLSNWHVSVKFLPSLQQSFVTQNLFFKLFHCQFVTNPTNSLCTCSVQRT